MAVGFLRPLCGIKPPSTLVGTATRDGGSARIATRRADAAGTGSPQHRTHRTASIRGSASHSMPYRPRRLLPLQLLLALCFPVNGAQNIHVSLVQSPRASRLPMGQDTHRSAAASHTCDPLDCAVSITVQSRLATSETTTSPSSLSIENTVRKATPQTKPGSQSTVRPLQ